MYTITVHLALAGGAALVAPVIRARSTNTLITIKNKRVFLCIVFTPFEILPDIVCFQGPNKLEKSVALIKIGFKREH
jgi:hypothetical protein